MTTERPLKKLSKSESGADLEIDLLVDSQQRVLKDVRLKTLEKIRKGERPSVYLHEIVGPVGSGKSTVLQAALKENFDTGGISIQVDLESEPDVLNLLRHIAFGIAEQSDMNVKAAMAELLNGIPLNTEEIKKGFNVSYTRLSSRERWDVQPSWLKEYWSIVSRFANLLKDNIPNTKPILIGVTSDETGRNHEALEEMLLFPFRENMSNIAVISESPVGVKWTRPETKWDRHIHVLPKLNTDELKMIVSRNPDSNLLSKSDLNLIKSLSQGRPLLVKILTDHITEVRKQFGGKKDVEVKELSRLIYEEYFVKRMLDKLPDYASKKTLIVACLLNECSTAIIPVTSAFESDSLVLDPKVVDKYRLLFQQAGLISGFSANTHRFHPEIVSIVRNYFGQEQPGFVAKVYEAHLPIFDKIMESASIDPYHLFEELYERVMIQRLRGEADDQALHAFSVRLDGYISKFRKPGKSGPIDVMFAETAKMIRDNSQVLGREVVSEALILVRGNVIYPDMKRWFYRRTKLPTVLRKTSVNLRAGTERDGFVVLKRELTGTEWKNVRRGNSKRKRNYDKEVKKWDI